MSQFLASLSYWLHSLATVILIGHYLLLSLVYIPALSNPGAAAEGGTALSAISRQSRSWMYLSLLIFLLTGVYLMVADPNYLGIGNFGNLWGVLMLLKHVLVLVMVGLGFWYNAILRVGPALSSTAGSAQALARFRQFSNAMAVSGSLVLLLTAIAQAG